MWRFSHAGISTSVLTFGGGGLFHPVPRPATACCKLDLGPSALTSVRLRPADDAHFVLSLRALIGQEAPPRQRTPLAAFRVAALIKSSTRQTNPNPLTVQCRILDNLLASTPYGHKTKLLSVDDSGRPWR